MATDRDNDQVTWDATVLRAARAERGWSIAEATRQLRKSADQPLPGHDSLVKAWKRWEAGTEPGRFYGPLLAKLLGSPDSANRSGVVEVFSRRALVPTGLWDQLVRTAHDDIWMLQHAGLFLPEQQPHLLELLAAAADGGARIRLLFGDPDCLAVTVRSVEDAIGAHSIAARIRSALGLYRPLADHPSAEVRLHTTTLYASIYRFDEHMLVANHIWGLPAAQAQVLRLGPGDLFDTYRNCFERVWSAAAPVPGVAGAAR